MGIRVNFARTSKSLDVLACNAALGVHFEAVDLAVYDLLETLYHGTSEFDKNGMVDRDAQDISYSRYKAWSSHPMYHFFEWQARTRNVEEAMHIELPGVVGESDDKSVIRACIRFAGFNEEAAQFITRVEWS